MTTYRRPTGLQPAGRALWKRVTGDVAANWQLDAKDLAALESACRATDRAGQLEHQVEDDGVMVDGSKGQPIVHPAIAEARLQRQLAAQLLARIELGPADRRMSERQREQLENARAARRWGKAA